MQTISNATVFTGNEILDQYAVRYLNGVIQELVPTEQVLATDEVVTDLEGGYLLPGFVDLQVNGGGGVLFNNQPTLQGLQTIFQAHRSFGTTTLLPTLITDSYDTMRKGIETVRIAIQSREDGIVGIHLEGPFLNQEKKGAHSTQYMRGIDEEGFEILTSLPEGKVIATLAPELVGPEMIVRLVDKGVVVCGGHSEATYEQTQTALEAGMQGFTHLFNAMPPLLSRLPGIVGAAITDHQSWFSVIADGHHVHPATFKIALAAKHQGGAILVTDAMPTVGSNEDVFALNGEDIQVRDGRCINRAGSLAGSHLDMYTAINNAAKFANFDLFEAVRMATVYPANALNLQNQIGHIKPGCRADFVGLSGDNQIVSTWVNGKQQLN